MRNKPPYTITEKAADYLAKIVETVTKLEYGTGFKKDVRLHKLNRAQSIYSSLAIEGNSLSLKEVKVVIEGKLVAGKQTEIKEVKNAYQAYDKIMTLDPYYVKDFLKAHSFLTQGLVSETGRFRSGDVGVFDGDKAIHVGARPQFVPKLIEDLFLWAKKSELHPVLKSVIVHYEIEIIHPFADGNGRMGRLWQTLILTKWNRVFAWIPMENLMHEKRSDYYLAISNASDVNDSSYFIEFTLSAVLDALVAQLKHQDKHQVKHQDKLSDIQEKIFKLLDREALSRKEVFAGLGLSSDSRAFKRHMQPLLDANLIEMTLPDKPNSKLQKYRKVYK